MSTILNYIEKTGDALLSFNFLSDFLDILLVAFIIYEGIKLIRGSRTFQLIKGIVVLGVVYALVKLFNMEACEYLLSVLFENGLIILVVLFSPELRNILEKFGRRSFSNISFFGLINSQTLATEEIEARSLMVWISFKSGPIEMQLSPGIFSERIPHSNPA